jgi:hypothetical protein
MVLAYSRDTLDQAEIALQIGAQPYLGAPARNVRRLASDKRQVIVENGDLAKVEKWLNNNTPVIAFLQAGELTHWRGEFFQHAVVIVEIDQDSVWMLDPDARDEPIAVGIGEFMLAWSELDYLYAVISKLG